MPDYSVTVIYKDGTSRQLDRIIVASSPGQAARKLLSVARPFSTDPKTISSIAMTTPHSFQAATRWLVDPITFKSTRRGYDK